MALSEPVSARIPEALYSSLVHYTELTGIRTSKVMVDALTAYLETATKDGHVCHACDGTGICD